MISSNREVVEQFHLNFLRLLSTGRDKASFIVKGGCNLRFFFGSVRYSEDLDLDVRDVPGHALKERVDSILSSKVLRETLAASGIELGRTSAPKQTDTTQRWKAELRASGREVALHTKIEFSRRGAEGESAFESVAPRLLQHYRMMPILSCHYLLPSAIRQKVGALIHRREVQARDIFDLSLLFSKEGDLLPLSDLARQVSAAVERVWAVSYSEYVGQVLAYLEPEHAEPVGSEESWEAIQLQVVSALESLRGGR